MASTMSPHCILPLLVLLLALTCATEQYFLGTHFYVNQDNTLVDNTLKTVSTLARPYDLVTFIRQSERLERVERLQSYIDAVDDVTDATTAQQRTDADQTDETADRCNDFLRDGESLVFKILRTNLYDAFHIPLELKNLSLTQSNEQRPMKVYTCTHFCHIHTSTRISARRSGSSDCRSLFFSFRSAHFRSLAEHIDPLRRTANDSYRRRRQQWNNDCQLQSTCLLGSQRIAPQSKLVVGLRVSRPILLLQHFLHECRQLSALRSRSRVSARRFSSDRTSQHCLSPWLHS